MYSKILTMSSSLLRRTFGWAIMSFKIINASGDKDNEDRVLSYVREVPRLQSTGPLNITNLNEFLEKSKLDFNRLYIDNSVSELKIQDFKVHKKLGSGAFGKVILAETKKEKELYAIKVIDKQQVIKGKHIQYVLSEKKVLQALNFPFVIYLKFFFVDNHYLFFVMPYVPGGDFYDYLHEYKPLKELHGKFYTCQLVLALEYLHYLDLIHRDVKPENIMMDGFGYLRLADFGQCIKCEKSERAWTFTGTPEYMAPEIIDNKGYDCAVDWWALGVTLFEICAGKRPFVGNNTDKLLDQIKQMKFEMPSFFSKHLTSLLKVLLVITPQKRIANHEKGAKEIKLHPWLKEMDWNAILNRTLPAPYVPA